MGNQLRNIRKKKTSEKPATKHPKKPATKHPKKSATKHPKKHPKKSATKHPKKSATKHPKKSATKHPKKSATKHPKKSATKHPKKSATKHPKKAIAIIQRHNLGPRVVTIIQKNNKLNNNNIYRIKYGLSPLTGYEPKYEPTRWNNNTKIRENHNCYSYAFNDIHSKRTGKAQPGYYANYPPINSSEYNCDAIYKRIKKDNPSVYRTKFDSKCGKGFYKSFFALSLGANTDYHFYRQDKNGYWSHKPGRTNATNLDASKHIIINPKLANRDYSHLNYSTPCAYFCVHPGMTKTHSTTQSRKY